MTALIVFNVFTSTLLLINLAVLVKIIIINL